MKLMSLIVVYQPKLPVSGANQPMPPVHQRMLPVNQQMLIDLPVDQPSDQLISDCHRLISQCDQLMVQCEHFCIG
jgi:hypothetical protein